jgi:outer membrane protein OmpA-like peptidoglycan-associated protein
MILAGLVALALLARAEGPAPPPGGELVEPLVYFAPGGVETRPANEANWRSIEAALGQASPGWIEVRAHTASSGRPADDMALSLARAEVVAARIARMGVDPALVTLVACGALQRAVQTGDGVEDPMNDRATMDWGPAPRRRGVYDADPRCLVKPYAPVR